MNKIILMGHIGKDARINQEKSCIEFSMATKESWKDKDGDWKTTTDWHFCKSYLKSSSHLLERLSKGARILIEGKQKNFSIKNEETGEYRNFNSVEVGKISILDSTKELSTYTTEDIPF